MTQAIASTNVGNVAHVCAQNVCQSPLKDMLVVVTRFASTEWVRCSTIIIRLGSGCKGVICGVHDIVHARSSLGMRNTFGSASDFAGIEERGHRRHLQSGSGGLPFCIAPSRLNFGHRNASVCRPEHEYVVTTCGSIRNRPTSEWSGQDRRVYCEWQYIS